MDAAAVIAPAVVEAQRSDWRRQRDADTDTRVQVVRRQAAVPSAAPVREQSTLHLLDDREAVLDRAEELAVAAELILALAAQ